MFVMSDTRTRLINLLYLYESIAAVSLASMNGACRWTLRLIGWAGSQYRHMHCSSKFNSRESCSQHPSYWKWICTITCMHIYCTGLSLLFYDSINDNKNLFLSPSFKSIKVPMKRKLSLSSLKKNFWWIRNHVRVFLQQQSM